MAWVAVAVAGSTLVSGVLSADSQSQAAGDASNAQAAASAADIAERRRQFDSIQALLKPYVDAGPGALTGQQDLVGLNGVDAQKKSIDAITNGPLFSGLAKQGENAILQNASATGNLRGGNTEGALAQFRPQLLQQLINDQYSKLGGLTQVGQNSAVMQGNAGLATTAGISSALQQQGAAQAGAFLAQGKADAQMWGNTAGAFGQFAGLGGFGKF